ncbi:hypothetical protein [Cryptosporangium minutisporangium]|uniref:Uncharacterized protein n=1 Tax=Cryptosporangium minutisporangium TaxID=113569 RepID=A0ABP6T536_9ACTN
MTASRRDPDDVGDDVLAELTDIAGNDPHTAALLRRSLERLREGVGGPALQEMARDVLAGNTTLRSAGSFSFYQEALTAGLERFRGWQQTVNPEEVRAAVQDAKAAASLSETGRAPTDSTAP